jgi:hypothetical protein
LVRDNWDQGWVSPHNAGVRLVPIPSIYTHRFYCSIVEVTAEMPLKAYFEPRVQGEAPFVQLVAPGIPKAVAKRVDIVLYSHETLAQDGDAPVVREADYYIVAVNAYADDEEEPMSPMTMARNFLGLKGGTKPTHPYTAEEFAKAILYWSCHVRVAPEE